MRRLVAAAGAIMFVVACGDEAAEQAAVAHWSEMIAHNIAANYTVTLSERIALRSKAVAALDEYDKKYRSTADAKEKAYHAGLIRERLAGEKRIQAAVPCLAPPHRACLLAEAEKRIQARSEFEALQIAALLAATGDRRHEVRLVALLAADARVDDIGPVIVRASAAKSAAVLEALAAYAQKKAIYREAAAIIAHVKGDAAAYAAEIERLKADNRLGYLMAQAIARHTRDRALFAEAVRQIRALEPSIESASELGLTMMYMAEAGLSEDVWTIAASTGPPLPEAIFAYAALARVAGDRRDAARLDALLKSEFKTATGTVPIKVTRAGPIVNSWMAYALARLGRGEEAGALIREAKVDARRGSDALTAIAVDHARQGRMREALDVVYNIDAEIGIVGSGTPLVEALLALATAAR